MTADVHPDVFSAERATRYLSLDSACPSPESAIAALRRLVKRHNVKTLRWGKELLYPRASLDSIVAAEAGEVRQ